MLFFGKSGLITYEDSYKDNDTYNVYDNEDEFEENGIINGNPVQQEVAIICPNKNRCVYSYLSEPLKFSASATWKEMFGGGMASTVGTTVGTVNDIAQYVKGWSFQQPWMNKKIYQSTTPLSFTITLPFVAKSDETAVNDVWMPLQTLMSFVYPRMIGTGTDNALTQVSDKLGLGLSKTIKSQTNADGTANKNSAGLITSIATCFKIYAIPGPGIRQTDVEGSQGDNVCVIIGNYLCFQMCYIEEVSVEMSNTMTNSGYPLWGKATLKITNSVGNIVSENGTFLFDGFSGVGDEVGSSIDAMSERIKDTAEKTLKFVKATWSFYSGGK